MVDNSKKVVLRKPKLDMDKQINLTPIPPPKKVDKPKPNQPRRVKEPVKKSEIVKEESELLEDEIDISDDSVEEPQKVLKTSSNRTIVATAIKPKLDTVKLEPKSKPAPKTFDEQFLDTIDIRSKIDKNGNPNKDYQVVYKPPKTMAKTKSKRKFKLRSIGILVISLLLTLFTYVTIRDYVNGEFTNSLASFIYVVAVSMLTIMMFVWFIIDITKEDKNNVKK